MNKSERIKLLEDAHQRYVDWWSPIDVAADSVMAPMDYHRFLESLLTLPDENWWDRWIGDRIPTEKKTSFKKFTLELIKQKVYSISKI